MIRYRKMNSLDQISSMRNAYMDQLIEPQGLYLERRIQHGHPIIISEHKKPVGYAILGTNKRLLEFYVKPEFHQAMNSLLLQTCRRFDIATVLCQSYDCALMACCLDEGTGVEVLRYSFRDHQALSGRFDSPWKEVQPAMPKDADKVKAIVSGLFDHSAEVDRAIENKMLLTYTINGSLLGCGLFQLVIHDRTDYHIGALVHPAHRRKGIGAAILCHLIDHVQSLGGRPIAGCAVENIGSKRTLERAGFVALYRLLSFSF